jgi:hypothetical protein
MAFWFADPNVAHAQAEAPEATELPDQPRPAEPQTDAQEASAEEETEPASEVEENSDSGARGKDEDASPQAPTAEQYAALEARLAALEAAREEEELTELTEDEVEAARQDTMKVYGFMDMGIQRLWTDERSIVSGFFEANAWTFAMGNIDIYFDANPHPDWRALAEVRFTNAPRGRINNFGGLAGEFEREDTQQFDPNSTMVNAPLWLGGVVIERAWIEWKG